MRKIQQWKVRRQLTPTTDALRRWDQAYQCLLRHKNDPDPDGEQPVLVASQVQTNQEVEDACSHLCAGLDRASSSGPNH
jgi:hypothetical protein